MIEFVDLKVQYKEIKDEINNAIRDVLENTSFIGGKTFEENFAKYIGVNNCIGVGNGTDALFIALKCLGIQQDDEVITSANTFIATSEAISRVGAKPVFVDCNSTYSIDTNLIEKAITLKTKAIVVVHLYGRPANMSAILYLVRKYNLFLIEDAAQAHGAQYNGKNIGTFGDCACFSFFPSKNLGAYGDAGAIATNNNNLATKIRMFANHGRRYKYDHEFEGINSRLDNLQAAILNVKLKYLDKWNAKRKAIAQLYNKYLENVITPETTPNISHVYHLYVIRLKNRTIIQNYLKEQGISTGIHYPIPLPFLKAYSYLQYKSEDFPMAFKFKDEILSLPIHGSMQVCDALYVIEKVKEATC